MVGTTADGAVRTITLDRPEKRNALTRETLRDLESTLADATAPVVVLRGAGEAFCAGADLDVIAGLDADAAGEFAALGQHVARTIEGYDGAVVAAVDGAARGGGVELALACDLRVATPAATFAETGVRLGLFGAWGGTVRLPRIVGESAAMDLALTGRTVDATEALRLGLVSRVTDEPRQVASELAAVDHGALRTVKGLLRDGGDREQREARERAAFAELIAARED
ncbi:enoyl-CoA hydratase/isomerase family protein [Haloarcula pelagica]|uniref:enoyl-CoA hydratase/isomerase family protein n=1 Tax=Haloarcula pelagica TaxID=3033389 RepID=UPI0024C42035|nr:enoyl-CoA hydratase/isomerase family protein [Halomicroarcula sp. YJ-61-S]